MHDLLLTVGISVCDFFSSHVSWRHIAGMELMVMCRERISSFSVAFNPLTFCDSIFIVLKSLGRCVGRFLIRGVRSDGAGVGS